MIFAFRMSIRKRQMIKTTIISGMRERDDVLYFYVFFSVAAELMIAY